MSATGLPEVVDGGQHRRRAPRVTGQRVGLGALLLGIAVATVAVPPLITPEQSAVPPLITPEHPAVPPSPAVVGPAVTAVPFPRVKPTSGGPQTCVPAARSGTVELTGRPACAVYTTGLGDGWTASGDGLKVLPGEVVPDTREPAMRVERSRPAVPATAMTIAARTVVSFAPGARLKLRVWGGREFGSVLKLSVAPTGTGAVTLTAPADKWTSYSVKLADLTRGRTLTRIKLVVSADQVPNVNRFFLDDNAIVD